MSSDIPTDVSESHVLAQALLNAPHDYVVILDRKERSCMPMKP